MASGDTNVTVCNQALNLLGADTISSFSDTTNDAAAVCKAYGNRLANYKEIKSSLDAGGEWCSYGWSDDQMALFPTQYDRID